MNVMEDSLPRVRLQMPKARTWIEASARVIWSGDSRRMVGIEFLDLADEFRKQLRDWLAAESTTEHQASIADHAPAEADLHDFPVEEVSKGPHSGNGASLLATRSTDFDLAALLTTSEATLPGMAHVPSGASDITPRPSQSVEETTASPAAKAKSSPARNRYVPAVAALAALSLAAGWEAGRGNVFQTFSEIFKPSAAAPISRAGVSTSSIAANSATVSFEVVDASNQAWHVPFAGPTSVAPAASAVSLAPIAPEAPSQSTIAKKRAPQIWTLPAPQARRSGAVPSGVQAPQMPDVQAGAAIPSAILEGSARTNVAAPAANSGYSTLVPSQVVRRVDPVYPKSALDQRIQGTVKVRAHVEEDGKVTNVRALSGSPLLTSSAVTAVQKWQYKPQILDGRPIASDVDVTIVFTLPQ
jgi:TonB family protein